MRQSLRTALLGVLAALLAGVTLSGCTGGGSTGGSGSAGGGGGSGGAGVGGGSGTVGKVEGGGSTLIAPLMEKWVGVYAKAKGVKVDYGRAGSGKGISQTIAGIYDFGCTDAPMSEQQLKEAQEHHGAVVHIPLAMGSIVPAYNLKGIDERLKFTGPVLADIYLGKIKKWNDKALADLNPGVKLPDQNIVVFRRSEPSGTTFTFTTYLSKVSPEWKEKVGSGLEVSWPAGDGAKGTDGVASQVSNTAGGLGYIEALYAIANKAKIQFGSVRNKKGKDVLGSDLAAITAAAEGIDIPDNLCFLLVDADGDNAYPICAVTWAVFYQNLSEKGAKGKALVEFFRWAVHDGQEETTKLDYAALPKKVVELIDKKLDTVKTAQ
jgi:phosphate ABC transporter phosphate-binding protein